MTIIRPLSEIDQLCLDCPIEPDCKPESSACPRRIALKGTRPPSTVDRVLQALGHLQQATSPQIAAQAQINLETTTRALYYLYKGQRIDRLPHRNAGSKSRFLYSIPSQEHGTGVRN